MTFGGSLGAFCGVTLRFIVTSQVGVPAVGQSTISEEAHAKGSALSSAATTRVVYGAAITLSAALAFLVEPMVARVLLPVYGGSAAVWATCLVFFQVALLLGYCAAHVLARRPLLQLALLAAPLALVPIWFSAPSAPPAGVAPSIWLLGQLALMVGAPFVALGSAGPALQGWFANAPRAGGRDPYVLYVASNFGSLVGLLAYPLVVEPALRVANQELLWTIAYVLFAAVAAACLVVGGRRRGVPATEEATEATEEAAPTLASYARWAALAALPVVLLIGATNELTIDVAAVPLLWVAPLAVYLVTLMVAFSPRAGRSVALAGRMLLPLGIVALIAAMGGLHPQLLPALGLHLAALLCAGIVIHARLAAGRPAARHLTSFYLAVAAGGAAGGVFASLIAPLIFVRPYEYPLGLLLALLALPALAVLNATRRIWLGSISRELAYVAVAVALLLIVCGANPLAAAPVAGLLVLPVLLRPWKRTMVVVMSLVVVLLATAHAPVLYESRTFYGVNRVTALDGGAAHLLGHGVTVHGAELMDPALRDQPLAYYRFGGPVDDAFASLATGPRQVAVVGLGTGSIAAYGRARDALTFYEIDPEVVRIARDPALFSYMTDAQGQVNVVIGDGRLELAQAPADAYDMVVLDAFSSDAVPVHLLTVEAITDYMRHLRPGGVLLFNLSNRYVNLPPVIAAAGRDLGLAGCVKNDTAPAGSDPDLVFNATWAVLGATQPQVCATQGWAPLPNVGTRSAWTDDFSDIVGALR